MVRRVLVSVSILPVTVLILTSVWLWAGPAQAQQESGSSTVSRPMNADVYRTDEMCGLPF